MSPHALVKRLDRSNIARQSVCHDNDFTAWKGGLEAVSKGSGVGPELSSKVPVAGCERVAEAKDAKRACHFGFFLHLSCFVAVLNFVVVAVGIV